MKDYENYTDEELIIRIRDGEKEITDYIINKYKDLVRKKAKSMYILGADNEDLIQEGMIGLFKAIRDYDAGRDASFFTFADVCVSRQMYSAVQAAHRKKHAPLNYYVSLYAGTDKDSDDKDSALLIDAVATDIVNNPEDLMIDNENVMRIEEIIDTDLSPLEKQVVDLFLTGMSYTEIARVLGRDEKSMDNALQRIKAKIRKGLDKN